MKKVVLFALVLFISFSSVSCSLYKTIANLARLKFKVGQVNDFTVSGVPVSNKSKLSDFSPQQIIMLTAAVAKGSLPVSFVLNIEAKNPNDGTGGYPTTSASIVSFPFRLLVDEKEVLTGNISSPVSVPGTGQVAVIPLTIGFDLIQMFKDKNYESLLNLVLNLGGQSRSSSRLTVYARPQVSTSFGTISYPGELKIVDREFN